MKTNQKKAWLFLAPTLIFVTVFSVWPILRAFTMSFQSGPLINMEWTGFSNYQYIFSDPEFWRAIRNTLIYSVFAVPISLAISIMLAWFIFSKVKHSSFFETTFFMPYVTSTIAIGIVFRYIFNGEYGLLNYLLKAVHLPAPNWIDDPSMSLITIIIFGIWTSLAFDIVILMGALRNIDPNYYVLADMYGASEQEKFWRITIPQLVPTLAFLLTMNIIGAFKIYTSVYALFNGQAGIGNSATTAVFYIYNKFQMVGTPGVAMAATVVLFLIILLTTFLQRKMMKKIGRY
ncbi:sugar ABC transporter permease [Lactobacillus jensenii]|jgi:sugar ABC transporter|uniref:Sugar ABC transporter permease n=1 Tax=Lactobacillus jensenii TaxID=109790 RepID=A0A5N1IJB0_LACJE|nr:sugar ABC transporter permease [Lactobacillus jensenii]EEQ67750.1 ABC transporter, permease protein [Lactobacillus jensenii 1153]APT15226.1 sugar ABC transporter permease [Lactobacillus jensenii]EEQ24169.1 ABC transporter, permease protein [Lactobacillus jensenii 269-3]EEX27168.1 ABC transporter, permease protein [Lactobacillus jensenii SJ-7A-US]KAA9234585.1 sugar ABC transporter permease [Lactobacillus jensenii]